MASGSNLVRCQPRMEWVRGSIRTAAGLRTACHITTAVWSRSYSQTPHAQWAARPASQAGAWRPVESEGRGDSPGEGQPAPPPWSRSGMAPRSAAGLDRCPTSTWTAPRLGAQWQTRECWGRGDRSGRVDRKRRPGGAHGSAGFAPCVSTTPEPPADSGPASGFRVARSYDSSP